MNFRCPPLLKLSYELPCQIQIPGICIGGKGEPCHANWSEFGKGERIKAHDCFFASGCRACHDALDQGSKFSKAQRKHFWLMGYIRTVLLLWQLKLITVAMPDISGGVQWGRAPIQQVATNPLPLLTKRKGKVSQTSRSSKTLPHPASLV